MLVETLAIGVCGTDREILAGEYEKAPPGEERLVLGHESIGRVLEAPDRVSMEPGDLVVGVVRRPDPCRAATAPSVSGTCAATASTPSTGSRRRAGRLGSSGSRCGSGSRRRVRLRDG